MQNVLSPNTSLLVCYYSNIKIKNNFDLGEIFKGKDTKWKNKDNILTGFVPNWLQSFNLDFLKMNKHGDRTI